MSSVDPDTAAITDPELPVVATLLGADCPLPLRTAVATTGGSVVACRAKQASWWPGSNITVQYRVTVEGGGLEGESDFVITAGSIPSGAIELAAEEMRVGVWRVPHDPVLRGLVSALDPAPVGALLDDLGVPGGPVELVMKAYRPKRRAVVAVGGRKARALPQAGETEEGGDPPSAPHPLVVTFAGSGQSRVLGEPGHRCTPGDGGLDSPGCS